MSKIEKLCINYNLGNLKEEPGIVTGGLVHKMYHVRTDQGEYAIKLLNPNIMKRTEALQNMENSEMVANALIRVIPLVAAKRFEGKSIIEFDGSFYAIFDWFDGKSIFIPDISEYHCDQVGRILGKMHAANIKVDSIKKNSNTRDEYDWNMLLEKAQQCNTECYLVLQENFADIIRWDHHVVSSLREVSQSQVISHRDLDPKNIMWKNNAPYIIDWEAAGYVNPFQELIEVLNYWIGDENGKYDKVKFDAMIQAYTESINMSHVNWDAVLNCSFDGMLGWLQYSIKRALGMEGIDVKDKQEGMQQTKETVYQLKKYENQMKQLQDWINDMLGCNITRKDSYGHVVNEHADAMEMSEKVMNVDAYVRLKNSVYC